MEKILLKQLTDQKLSFEEKEKLKKWLNADPKNQDIYNQMKLMFLKKKGAAGRDLKTETWNDLMTRINKGENIPVQPEKSPLKLRPWMKIAASVTLIAAVWLGVDQILPENRSQQIPEVLWVKKVSLNGQKISLALPDGTVVKLNAGSELLAPETFAGDTRTVTLKGEAFFQVAENQNKPFIIHADKLKVKVLGTSFNVRAYPGEHKVHVAVETGNVAVSDLEGDLDPKELLPGEILTYIDSTKQVGINQFNWEEELGWKENLLIFNKNNLFDILNELTRWYGVEFVVSREFSLQKDYSGRYENPTLTAVLDGLSFVYDFQYEIDEKKVTIK